MPDHLHAILTPAPDVSLEKAVQFIKGNFSHRLKSKLPVWTPSFNEVQVRDRIAFDSFQHYIHQNPVRANLVLTAEAFPFSSVSKHNLIDPPPAHFRITGAEAPQQHRSFQEPEGSCSLHD
jgi:putative transposase